MATDARDSRRKHRRSSSPDDVDRSSKRHKHRHHSHRHRHRHGSKKRDEEIEFDDRTIAAVSSPTPPRHLPDDDVEEGEILEDEALDGEVGKKDTESDVEPGEIKVTGDRDVRSDNQDSGHLTKKSETRNEAIQDVKFISPAYDAENNVSPNCSSAEIRDGKHAQACTDGEGNGYLDPKSSKGDKWQNGEFGHFKGNEKLKGDFDDGTLEANARKAHYHGNSSAESGGEIYRMSGSSPSHGRYRSRSRSIGHTRDRSRSRSIIDEYAHSKRRRSDYDHDEERVRARGREHRHGSVVDDRREYSTKYHNREAQYRDRSRDRDVNRGLHREKRKEETSRGKEIEWEHKRGKERERSRERYRRDVEKDRSREREEDRDLRQEKERDRSWDTVFERDRRREKERDISRGRTRGGKRDRDLENERDDKNRERDTIKERERRDDRYRYKDRDIANGKDGHLRHEDGNDNGHRYRKHSRHGDNEYHWERKRNSDNPGKGYNSMGSTAELDESNVTGSEVEPDDLEEDTLQLPEQEEEDLNRIKEESRRRREAIMEKYKKQHQQVEEAAGNKEKDKDADIPNDVTEARDGKNDDADYVEPSFAVGKSPENVNVASKVSLAGGLGEGTPKSERSEDKFCDDIFGETPTGVRKSGKGDGLLIERIGQHDNWDDAEGYYSKHYNMNRIRLVWSRIWNVLSDFFVSVGLSENLSVAIFAMDSLRQLAMKFLEREELANYNFQNEFLRPYVIVMQKSNTTEIRELIVRCISQMVLSRVSNVKSGWKSVFMVFTAAAADERKNIVLLAFETMEKIVREFFPYITETETMTFTDCVRCLLTFTNSRFNSDVSLNAIAFLRFCAVRLADGGLVCNKKSSVDGLSVVENGISDLQAHTDNDDHVSFWNPLLSGLSKLTSDPRSAIRKSSLEVLFNILKDHGHLFSHTFWNSIFCSVIFPVYNSVSGKREMNLQEAHCSSSSVSVQTEGSTWDSETYSVAAECLIDLFVTFFDVVRSQLPGVVSVLTGFIRSPVQGPASTGVAGLVRLTCELGNRLSAEEWKEIFLCLKDAAMSTVPGFMKVLRTMNNIEVPNISQHSADLESSSDHDLTNDEFDDDNLQTATYVVSRTKNHIAMQLLIVQVATDLYKKHQQSLSAPSIKVLIELYSSIALHAREMNRESILLKKLQKAGSTLEISGPPMVHFENESFQNHLNFLQNIHLHDHFVHDEIDLEQELVVVCENVLDIYLNCAGSVSTFHKSDTMLTPHRKLPLSSAKKEEIAARTSLVISALQGLAGLKRDSFRRYIPRFFHLLVDLVRSEHTSGEVQHALSNLFRSSVGQVIMD